jgi:hypothetical protein
MLAFALSRAGPARETVHNPRHKPKQLNSTFGRINMPLPKGLVMPGPGTHTPNFNHTPRAASHFMGNRVPEPRVDDTPGPGAYSFHDGGLSQRGTRVLGNTSGRDEPKRYISPKHAQSELGLHTPGPIYEAESCFGAKASPGASFSKAGNNQPVYISAQHSKEHRGQGGPGPTAYSPRTSSSRRASKFGRAPQRPVYRDPEKPGPGAYSTWRPKAGNTGCSFGTASTFRGMADGRNTARIL